jgi:DNA invertase Pin-like site-specific DNA recombinase
MVESEARRHGKGTPVTVAKLDRLSRDVHFVSAWWPIASPSSSRELGPDVPPFLLHILASVAEQERRLISERTKAALAAAKARGVKLGNPRLGELREPMLAARKEGDHSTSLVAATPLEPPFVMRSPLALFG